MPKNRTPESFTRRGLNKCAITTCVNYKYKLIKKCDDAVKDGSIINWILIICKNEILNYYLLHRKLRRSLALLIIYLFFLILRQ